MHVTAHLDVDLVAVEATDTVTLMLDLQAPEAVADPATARPEHTAIVVLDRSGSMSGHRLEAAKRALIDLVARLDDRDTFGLVTFDDTTQVVAPAGKVADHGRTRLARLIQDITPGGMTDLSGGYLRGLQEARRGSGPAGATIVLLSDGHANAGITDPAALRQVAAKAGAQAITTSTIGIGHGYDQDLLAEIATGGNGNHSFAADADSAAAALITPTNDVTQIGILNDLPAHAVSGGIMVELGDFYSGETRRLLLELHIPAMAALGLAQVAELTLTYVELPALTQHTVTLPVSVNVVPADVAAQRVPSPEVHREKLLLSAQAAKRASEDALARGDYDTARTTLDGAAVALAAMPGSALTDEVAAEIAWLHQTRDGLTDWDTDYSSKRLRAEANRKSRGYKNREQGGERP
jgi:Ca-activated chloride channel family protein